MPLLLTYFHMYWRLTVLQDLYTNTVENKPKGANGQSAMQICAKQEKEDPHTLKIQVLNHQQKGSSPATSPPAEGGGQRGRPRCGCTRGAGAPPPPPPGPTLHRRCIDDTWGCFRLVSYFISP